MRGYPGTGKSVIARAIANALHAPLIDRDVLRQAAVNVFGSHPEIGRFSYELMFALTKEQLSLGLSVVIDTTLTYRVTYEQARGIAEEFHVPMLVVHCQCSQELQRQRIEGRKGQVSPFQITSWEEWQRWKPRFEDFDDHGCVLDTAHPLEESLAKVMDTIRGLHQRDDYSSYSLNERTHSMLE